MSTYGPRPSSFELEEGGERYYIGSEVGNYLKYHRGTLYKKYSLMWKRVATMDEKEKIRAINASPAFLNTNIMLVRQSEVDDILAGNDEKYKVAGNAAPRPEGSFTPMKPNPAKQGSNQGWGGQQVQSGSHHVEAVPASHPIAHGRGKFKLRETIYSTEDFEQAKRIRLNADIPEELVPIRLDMEIDQIKLRDTFCFNRRETIITPDVIAEQICDDLDLPAGNFQSAITSAIYQQLEAAECIPLDTAASDQRVLIKLNINVGNQNLVDQFEWDMSDPLNNPEEFAKSLCSDLGLGGEFPSAIAYSIRKRYPACHNN
ncbi:unnamed protein product, partial [Mesorhabditis spiculigera]